jgi:indole-3-glycerol phosphate synthase
MRELIDPNDQLASNDALLKNAIEILDEIRFNVSDENANIPIVIDTDPEWFDASLEYIRDVLEAVKERLLEEEII